MSITRTGVGTTTFAYSGDGARVKKVGPSRTIRYAGGLEDHVTDGVQIKHIETGSLRIATRVIGGPNAGTYFVHGDHLGSLNVLTNSSGTEVQRLTYFPFGETYTNTGTADFFQHRFAGHEEDPETGLYYYGARYYNPALGQFISADSLVAEPGDPQSFNRYSYVRNNPINRVDPSGHWDESDDTGYGDYSGYSDDTGYADYSGYSDDTGYADYSGGFSNPSTSPSVGPSAQAPDNSYETISLPDDLHEIMLGEIEVIASPLDTGDSGPTSPAVGPAIGPPSPSTPPAPYSPALAPATPPAIPGSPLAPKLDPFSRQMRESLMPLRTFPEVLHFPEEVRAYTLAALAIIGFGVVAPAALGVMTIGYAFAAPTVATAVTLGFVGAVNITGAVAVGYGAVSVGLSAMRR